MAVVHSICEAPVGIGGSTTTESGMGLTSQKKPHWHLPSERQQVR